MSDRAPRDASRHGSRACAVRRYREASDALTSRCRRSATCVTAGAPMRQASAKHPERSRSITATPDWRRAIPHRGQSAAREEVDGARPLQVARDGPVGLAAAPGTIPLPLPPGSPHDTVPRRRTSHRTVSRRSGLPAGAIIEPDSLPSIMPISMRQGRVAAETRLGRAKPRRMAGEDPHEPWFRRKRSTCHSAVTLRSCRESL